jgi:hypothetical protein
MKQTLLSEQRAKIERCGMQINAVLSAANCRDLTEAEVEEIGRLRREISSAVQTLMREAVRIGQFVQGNHLAYFIAALSACVCSTGLELPL